MGAWGTLSGASQASNPIFTLSNSHKPNETTLGNMYGVGYTDGSASFITGGASGWGFYVAADGDARTWLCGKPGGVSYIAKNGGRVGIGTDSPSQTLHVQGNIFASGTITPSSDRRAKTDLEPVDPKEVLERVAELPIERWRFKTEDEGVKHVGPMAQDFHEAFGLGESDTAIATVDADGVAFAAIQGLNLKLNEKEAEIDSLETRNRGLEAEMETLQDEVALLKASLSRLEELVGKMGQGL